MKGFPRPLALSVSVMLEGWTDDSAPGIGPMGNPLKSGVLDHVPADLPDRIAPKLIEHYERIKNEPGVKAYYAKYNVAA